MQLIWHEDLNIVAEKILDFIPAPVSISIDTYGHNYVGMSDGEIAQKIFELFDLRPKSIERQLKLKQPMYNETAVYGHMGRKNEVVEKS